MNNEFRTIDDKDLEDFIDECKGSGIDPSEFELAEFDVIKTELNAVTSIVNGKLTISRGDKARTYMTGDSADWLVDFARDLRKGVFS